MRLVCAHIIITAYGFWLPNDPRGSWSDFVGAWELLRFGAATKVQTRRSVAHFHHDRVERMKAKRAMKHPPVRFSGLQARAIGRGFRRAIDEGGYRVAACSILPDHVHLVVEPGDKSFERMVAHLKGRATQQLRAEKIHPFGRFAVGEKSPPSPWAEGMWKVYCFDLEHARSAIRYVRENPLKEGKPIQRWSFMTEWNENDVVD